MSNQAIRYEVENNVAILTITNPPLNVLSAAVIEGLEEYISRIEDDTEVIAVILTGDGDKAFMAGADIKSFPNQMTMGAKGVEENTNKFHALFNRFDFLPKPTIAAINGITFGGGCELALLCDIRIAEEHATIGLPEIKLGLFPGGGGTQRLPRLIGESKAKELMFTGEPITATTAERIGLVNHVVAKGESLTAAKELAAKITRHSLPSLSLIKQAVDQGLDTTLEEGLKIEAANFGKVFETEDVKEGVRAFIEKRKPQFKHK